MWEFRPLPLILTPYHRALGSVPWSPVTLPDTLVHTNRNLWHYLGICHETRIWIAGLRWGVLPSVTMNRFLNSISMLHLSKRKLSFSFLKNYVYSLPTTLLFSILETSTDHLDSWESFIAGCAKASLPQKPVGISNLRTRPGFTYSQRHYDSWLFACLAMISKNGSSF